jgi:hypothetical protein
MLSQGPGVKGQRVRSIWGDLGEGGVQRVLEGPSPRPNLLI